MPPKKKKGAKKSKKGACCSTRRRQFVHVIVVDVPNLSSPRATATLAGGDAGVGDPGVIAKSLELQNEALQRQLG